MGSNYGSKVHFNESTSFDVDSGGQVVFAEGATLSMPVLGTTVFASTDVITGTTLPNTGVVLLTQNHTTELHRKFTVKAPVKGCRLDVIVASTASTGVSIQMYLGSGVGVLSTGTTSKEWIIASSDNSPSTYRSLSLVGLSTSLWGCVGKLPSDTGWLFVATSS
jgi:hypothetical protein